MREIDALQQVSAIITAETSHDILQTAWPDLIIVGALWLATFPVAMALLAMHQRRGAAG